MNSPRLPSGLFSPASLQLRCFPVLVLPILIMIALPSSSSLSLVASEAFARLPHVRRALLEAAQATVGAPGAAAATAITPSCDPRCVLTFYYGVDYANASDVHYKLRRGRCVYDMSPLWFGSDPQYDDLCRSYAGLVRWSGSGGGGEPAASAAGEDGDWTAGGDVRSDGPWHKTVDGWTAQLLLCDQFPRNAFRGTPEAFAYEDPALRWARRLAQLALDRCAEETPDAPKCREPAAWSCREPATSSLPSGELHPPYLSSVVLALMHSEELADHDLASSLLRVAPSRTPPHLSSWWEATLRAQQEHQAVLLQFGRYPHRNRAKGRGTSDAEREWLSSDSVPGWARSQG
jgi:uncharacterized protein (DUF924 family)